MKSVTTKKRDVTFDLMKFFGIILVIIGHMTNVGVNVIFSFHMPLFFIIAGYFYHQKDMVSSFKSDARRLIYPYLLTAGAVVATYIFATFMKSGIDVKYWIIATLYGNGSVNHSSLCLSKVPSIGAIWFLLALFWCKNVFNLIYSKTRYWLVISLMIAFVAIAIDKYLINLPFAILPGLSAMIFYSIGAIIRRQGGFLKISPFLWSVIVLVWIISFLFSDMSMVRCYYKNILINIIGACGGCYVIYLVSSIISTYHNRLVSLFEWGGVNSMTFLCIHLYDLDVPIRSSLHISGIKGIPLVIMSCFIGTIMFYHIPLTRKILSISKLNLN